ncbi:hypothetical protein CALCODRAFT_484327 [Calocera cornea HHB12733]|uniref:Uncharacterized protein n=1 Tax=Calocera cornea HHB12733 TaxID=1353952 RepID=A0A165F1V7_9BASI|nr:hypothetical protein CALCODRAFT_484327 [Calocera cornea HHB12733]
MLPGLTGTFRHPHNIPCTCALVRRLHATLYVRDKTIKPVYLGPGSKGGGEKARRAPHAPGLARLSRVKHPILIKQKTHRGDGDHLMLTANFRGDGSLPPPPVLSPSVPLPLRPWVTGVAQAAQIPPWAFRGLPYYNCDLFVLRAYPRSLLVEWVPEEEKVGLSGVRLGEAYGVRQSEARMGWKDWVRRAQRRREWKERAAQVREWEEGGMEREEGRGGALEAEEDGEANGPEDDIGVPDSVLEQLLDESEGQERRIEDLLRRRAADRHRQESRLGASTNPPDAHDFSASLPPPADPLNPPPTLSYGAYRRATRDVISLRVIAGKKRVAKSGVIRSIVTKRIKSAVKYVVERGMDVDEKGRLVPKESEAGLGKWILPDWHYVFHGFLPSYRQPMQALVRRIRDGLELVRTQGGERAEEWAVTDQVAEEKEAAEGWEAVRREESVLERELEGWVKELNGRVRKQERAEEGEARWSDVVHVHDAPKPILDDVLPDKAAIMPTSPPGRSNIEGILGALGSYDEAAGPPITGSLLEATSGIEDILLSIGTAEAVRPQASQDALVPQEETSGIEDILSSLGTTVDPKPQVPLGPPEEDSDIEDILLWLGEAEDTDRPVALADEHEEASDIEDLRFSPGAAQTPDIDEILPSIGATEEVRPQTSPDALVPEEETSGVEDILAPLGPTADTGPQAPFVSREEDSCIEDILSWVGEAKDQHVAVALADEQKEASNIEGTRASPGATQPSGIDDILLSIGVTEHVRPQASPDALVPQEETSSVEDILAPLGPTADTGPQVPFVSREEDSDIEDILSWLEEAKDQHVAMALADEQKEASNIEGICASPGATQPSGIDDILLSIGAIENMRPEVSQSAPIPHEANSGIEDILSSLGTAKVTNPKTLLMPGKTGSHIEDTISSLGAAEDQDGPVTLANGQVEASGIDMPSSLAALQAPELEDPLSSAGANHDDPPAVGISREEALGIENILASFAVDEDGRRLTAEDLAKSLAFLDRHLPNFKPKIPRAVRKQIEELEAMQKNGQQDASKTPPGRKKVFQYSPEAEAISAPLRNSKGDTTLRRTRYQDASNPPPIPKEIFQYQPAARAISTPPLIFDGRRALPPHLEPKTMERAAKREASLADRQVVEADTDISMAQVREFLLRAAEQVWKKTPPAENVDDGSRTAADVGKLQPPPQTVSQRNDFRETPNQSPEAARKDVPGVLRGLGRPDLDSEVDKLVPTWTPSDIHSLPNSQRKKERPRERWLRLRRLRRLERLHSNRHKRAMLATPWPLPVTSPDDTGKSRQSALSYLNRRSHALLETPWRLPVTSPDDAGMQQPRSSTLSRVNPDTNGRWEPETVKGRYEDFEWEEPALDGALVDDARGEPGGDWEDDPNARMDQRTSAPFSRADPDTSGRWNPEQVQNEYEDYAWDRRWEQPASANSAVDNDLLSRNGDWQDDPYETSKRKPARRATTRPSPMRFPRKPRTGLAADVSQPPPLILKPTMAPYRGPYVSQARKRKRGRR